jgi:hypothetical protein
MRREMTADATNVFGISNPEQRAIFRQSNGQQSTFGHLGRPTTFVVQTTWPPSAFSIPVDPAFLYRSMLSSLNEIV